MALPGLLMNQSQGWPGWGAPMGNPVYGGRALMPGMTIGATNVKGDPGSRSIAPMAAPVAPRRQLAQMMQPQRNPRWAEGWGGERGGYGSSNRGGYTSSGSSNYGGGYGSQYH